MPPHLLSSSPPLTLEKVASRLKEGGLVALPTETVYGLAANAYDSEAVQKIYALKRRPSFNPLIVHVHSLEQAESFCDFSPLAQKLAQTFWPGPLTLILPLKSDAALSPHVTAGLPTVAVRVPRHPFFRALLESLDFPLAAPSANPSGLTSPVSALHVQTLFSAEEDLWVVDGGDCGVGLESTIVHVEGDEMSLLRWGGLSLQDIEKEVCASFSHKGLRPFDKETHGSEGQKVMAPGQLLKHYSPGKPVRLEALDVRAGEGLLAFGTSLPAGNYPLFQLSERENLEEAASRLFKGLHTLGARSDVASIAVMPIPQQGVGEAILDRLRRAALS